MAHPTGFFDLSLELRQMIYQQLYFNREDFSLTRMTEHNVHKFCQVDSRIKEEIADWENSTYKRAWFPLRAIPWQPPERLHHKKLERITIRMHHYCASEVELKSLTPKEKLSKLEIMRTNLDRLVNLTNISFTNPPKFQLHFLDQAGEDILTDPFWTQDMDHTETMGNPLATIDDSDRSKTIVQYLLEPLINLRVCPELRLVELEHVFRLKLHRHVDLSDISPRMLRRDYEHMWTLLDTLEAWVEGRVDRNEMTFHQRWKKLLLAKRHGRPGDFWAEARPRLVGAEPSYVHKEFEDEFGL